MTKRKTSQKKIEANRRNARRSTGPRDCSKTRLNATKHGILSKGPFIGAGDGREDPAEYEALCEAFRVTYAPEGTVEYILVDHLAWIIWRHERLIRHETASVYARSHNADEVWDQAKGIVASNVNPTGDYRDLPTSVLRKMKERLELEQAVLSTQDPIKATKRPWFTVMFSAQEEYGIDVDRLLALPIPWFYYEFFMVDHLQQVVTAIEKKAQVPLKQMWESLKDVSGEVIEGIDAELDRRTPHLELNRALLSFPSSSTLDQIMRYEPHLLRSFERIGDQLLKAQERRCKATSSASNGSGVEIDLNDPDHNGRVGRV